MTRGWEGVTLQVGVEYDIADAEVEGAEEHLMPGGGVNGKATMDGAQEAPRLDYALRLDSPLRVPGGAREWP